MESQPGILESGERADDGMTLIANMTGDEFSSVAEMAEEILEVGTKPK